MDTNVTDSTEVTDEPRLTVGILAPHITIGPDGGRDTLATADGILNTRGGSARADKNAIVLVAADQAGIAKARQGARSLAAMRDITRDQARLKRLNQEQKDQLAEPLAATEDRLPQQVVMATELLSSLGVLVSYDPPHPQGPGDLSPKSE